MTSDRPPPTFTEAELPAITPLEFVVTPGEGGVSTTARLHMELTTHLQRS